jgi:hypothetical protein
MKSYRIKVNDEYFAGVSEEVYDIPVSDGGWYEYRKEMNKLLFGEPHEIEGVLNLKSYIEKIIAAEREGYIDLKGLTIEGGQECR